MHLLQLLTENMKNSTKEKFAVALRIKPTQQNDKSAYKSNGIAQCLQIDTSNTVALRRKNSDEKIFKFNHIMLHENQEEVYRKSVHLVESVFEGHNATFLAYGQTGTGKTYTVFGGQGHEHRGFFYRSVEHIFSMIKEKMMNRQFAVRVSFIEFYMDNIFDLIQGNGRKLEIKQNADEGVYVKDLKQVPVKSAQELFEWVRSAIDSRKTEETLLNNKSSRSHAVVQIQVLQKWSQAGQILIQKSMLKIVDLAGNERVSRTQSYGPRLEEAKRINKQISSLGKCINLLAHNEKEPLSNKTDIALKFNFSKTHIPYRDSKITRFLKDSLEGRSKIFLCVCVSPLESNCEETLSSLTFAAHASTLKIESRRNQVFSLSRSIDISRKSKQLPFKGRADNAQPSHKDDEAKNRNEQAIKKMFCEVNDIQNYLQGKGILTSSQSKEQLQNNLKGYQKILSIMKAKIENPTNSKKL